MGIFMKYSALERLEIRFGRGSAGGLRLRHIVRKQWVCQNLTHLEIPIQGEVLQDASYSQFFRCKFSPARADIEAWQYWIDFCWRLGQLHRLRTLKLRREGDETFPAMLAFSNLQKDVLGCPRLVRNLKELRELQGPFHFSLPEVAASFGEKEAMWVLLWTLIRGWHSQPNWLTPVYLVLACSPSVLWVIMMPQNLTCLVEWLGSC